MASKSNKDGKASMAARTVVTPEFRVSYPYLFKKKEGKDGKPDRYSLAMLFPKKKTDFDEPTPYSKEVSINSAIQSALEEAGYDEFKKKMKDPIKDGDEEDDEGDIDPVTKGHWIINASSWKNRPRVVDRDNQDIDPEEGEEIVYPGCYAQAQLRAFFFDNESKGVSFQILMLKKTRDGERLDGDSTMFADPNEVFGISDDAPPAKSKSKSKSRVVEEVDEEEISPKTKKKKLVVEEDEGEEYDLPPPSKKKKQYATPF